MNVGGWVVAVLAPWGQQVIKSSAFSNKNYEARKTIMKHT